MNNHEQEWSLRYYFVPFTTVKAIHLIVIIGLIVFSNGLFNNFVKDDHGEVVENPAIQSLQNIPELFHGGLFFGGQGQALVGSFYRPSTGITFSLIYALFGSHYFGFHLVQTLLYILNTCFVFLLFTHFFRRSLAFFLSLVFLVHPINSEAAFYISAMQEVLFFSFGIVALWMVQKYQSHQAIIIAIICLLLSLLSKETGILFFFIAYVYVFTFMRKHFYLFLGYSVPVLLIYFTLHVSAIGIFAATTPSANIQSLSLPDRLLNIPAIVLFYIQTFLFPLYLSSSYHWIITKTDLNHFWLPLLLDIIFLAIISISAWFISKRSSRKNFTVFLFFTLWFLFGILLHLQIVPLDKTVAEQWFYFPIVGLLGMIGVLIQIFYSKLKSRWMFIFCAILLLLLATRTFVRSFDWRNDFTIATHDIAVSPDAYDLESEIGYEYFKQGNLKEAKIYTERSIQLYPTITNYTNLGTIYGYLGDYYGAKRAYLNALHHGDYYLTYENLATLAMTYGDKKENIHFIKHIALKKYPYNPKLWLSLAGLEYLTGNKQDALIDIEKAYHAYPNPQIISVYEAMRQNKPIQTKLENNNF